MKGEAAAGAKEERPKRKYTRRAKPEVPPIAPAAFAEVGTAPDMKRVERSPISKRARWRSLEAQITRQIEALVALRMQLQQMEQEEVA